MEFLTNNLELIYILLFCIFIGIEVLTNVPSVLHTPLMSGANAISGVITVGAVALLLNLPEDASIFMLCLGGLSVFLGTLNIAGGFLVTRRMLKMFNVKKNA